MKPQFYLQFLCSFILLLKLSFVFSIKPDDVVGTNFSDETISERHRRICVFVTRYTAALFHVNCIKSPTDLCRPSVLNANLLIRIVRPILYSYKDNSFTLMSLFNTVNDIIGAISSNRDLGQLSTLAHDQNLLRELYFVLYWIAIDMDRVTNHDMTWEFCIKIHEIGYMQIMHEPPTVILSEACPDAIVLEID